MSEPLDNPGTEHSSYNNPSINDNPEELNKRADQEIKRSGFSIGKFSVQNPVLVTILMVTLLALGLFSTLRLPQEQFAEVPFFWVNVIVPFPGVSAEDMEASVTVPVENAFQGINRLRRISSTTSEGLSVVRVEFDDGISNDEFRTLFQESQTRFSQVRLPEGILTPLVDDFSSADFLPVAEVVVSGDVPYNLLRREANRIRDLILRVRDVSDVDLVGARDRQIILDIDPIRLTALGMSTTELLRAVQDQNQSIPGGTVQSGGREFLLRTLGGVQSINDFPNIIVRRSDESGGMVRVQDVAQVIDGFDPAAAYSRFNGQDAISLRVTKVPRGSSVAVVQGTRAILNQIESSLPQGLSATIFNDSTVQIQSSLSVLISNAGVGLVLLVIILWLFIGFRNAMITGLGIPVTFALTFITLEFLGETINTNTLFGLVLVLGLIVDHGIVIVENSYRLQQNGLSRHNAAIIGTNQVVWPVIAATLTTVAAFLPLMLIPGTIGRFLRVIPLTVAIALLVSTFEALFFLPSHFADWGKEKKVDKHGNKPKEPGAWFEKVRVGYDRFIQRAYQKRGLVLALVFIVAVGSFSLVGSLRQDLFAAENFSNFTIDITMPTGTALERTDMVVRQFEEVLISRLGDGEVQAIRASVGTAAGGTGSTTNSNVAQIVVDLTEVDEGRARSIETIIDDVRSQTWMITGPDSVLFRRAVNGPPTSAPISFRFSANSLEQLTSVSRDIQNYLRTIPGVSNIEDDLSPGSPELQVRINSERASALGVTTSTLGNFLRARFDGLRIGTFFENNEEIGIILRFGDNRGFESLEQAFIPTEDGRLVPFSSVASIVQTGSLGSIRRVDGRREVTITADAADDLDLRPINTRVIDLWNNQLALQYPGVEFRVGGEFSEFQDLLIEILRVFLFGIFLIYLILGAQFNSYSQPFLILLSVPFAFVGVVLFLFFSGTPFSTTVLYAGVALAGIAVNDAIVLISFINELRAEGKSVKEAVTQAAGTRLRPILLTSLTTIAGLLPTALGIGGESVVWGPMASTIVFGLVFSTMTALLIIPMLYGVLFDKDKKKAPKKIRAKKAAKIKQSKEESQGIVPGGQPAPALKTRTVTSLVLILLATGMFLGFVPSFAHAQRYPSLDSDLSFEVPALDPQVLEQFYANWIEGGQVSLTNLFSETQTAVTRFSAGVSQLEVVRDISRINRDALRNRLRPTISLNPPDLVARAPLYSLTYRDESTGFGGATTPESWTNQFGLGLRVSQLLPTGGSLRGDLLWSTSATRSDDSWIFGQSPSVGISLDQPLFLGPGFIRFDQPWNNLEKAQLDLEQAAKTLETTTQSITLTALRLGTTRQQLWETQWILRQNAALAFQNLQRADQDLQLGITSPADIRRQRAAYEQILLSITELEKEILEITRSIQDLGGEQLGSQIDGPLLPGPVDPLQPIPRLSQALSSTQALESFLRADGNYQNALRDLRRVELDRLIGNPSDTPRLGISFNLTPGPTSDKDTFGSSVSGLFDGSSKPGYQFSVTLQIPDLLRRTSRTLTEIQTQQELQARIALDDARENLTSRLRNLEGQKNNLMSVLAIRLEDYSLASADLQEELIRLQQGTSNTEQLRRRQIAEYSAAFGVLQALRQLELLSLEVDQLAGAMRN
jgi:multidrug efflux pump subunit AcrB/outer membrane protein TolC